MTSRSDIKGAGAGSRGAVQELEVEGAWQGTPGRPAAGVSAMFYSGLLTEGGRKETDMREAASLRQQRRMKQAVQFIHKDSADLLPLDGLKKLGSSKDTVSSPHRPHPSRASGPPLPPRPLLSLSLSHRPGLSLSAPWRVLRQNPSLSIYQGAFLACSPLAQSPLSRLSPSCVRKKETLPYCPQISSPLAYLESKIWLLELELHHKSCLPLPPHRLRAWPVVSQTKVIEKQ